MGVIITRRISATRCGVVFSAVLIALAVWPIGLSADSTQYGAVAFSGQATVVPATVLGITTTISETGEFPASGDAQESSLISVGVPELLKADVAPATTVGQADRARSDASRAELSLTVGGNSIAAQTLRSSAMTVCTSRARSPVHASSTPLRIGPHVSGAMRVATLGCCDFFIGNVSVVFTAE